MDHSIWAVTLGSLTCEEGSNFSTRDLSFIYMYFSCERRVGSKFIDPAQPTDAPSSQRSSWTHFYTPGFTPFRGLVPLGRRKLVSILPPAHPLGEGSKIYVIYIFFAKVLYLKSIFILCILFQYIFGLFSGLFNVCEAISQQFLCTLWACDTIFKSGHSMDCPYG